MARTKSWDYDQNVVFNLGSTKKPEMYRINIQTQKNELEQDDFTFLENKLAEKINGCPALHEAFASIGMKLTLNVPYDPNNAIDKDF
jgi:hypothetical protein